MCRVEERVYVGADGRRRTFEESFLCEHARHNRLCPNVRRKMVDYPLGPPLITRDDTSSPASTYNPPTPTGSGPYVLEERAPSHSRNGSNAKEAKRLINPEIIIQIGSSKKGKGREYRGTSSKSYKRSSMGAASTGSNEIAVDSPSSDASFTLRTGFPEAPMPPNTAPAYAARPAGAHGHGYSNSASSIVSQAPSLYVSSEPESPSLPRASRYHPTVIHNPGHLPPPSPTTAQGSSLAAPVSYRTTIVEPRGSTEQITFRFDNSDSIDSVGASRGQSKRAAAPEIFDRDAERARQRQARTDAEKREANTNREMREAIQRDEEARQVRFELGRYESRATERAENSYAYREMRRAEEREEERKKKEQERAAEEARRKKKEEQAAEEARQKQRRELNERAANAARREAERQREEAVAQKERQLKEAESKLRSTKRQHRRSMSHSQQDVAAQERKRLLAETHAQMAIEREAAEQREREEEAALAAITMSPPSTQGQQQQSAVDPHYYDPRGGSRIPGASENVGLARRNSMSARRGSVSSAAVPAPLGRSSSKRRTSIVQPAPPANLSAIGNAFSCTIVSPTSSQVSYSRPPSARHSSYDVENPFAAPPSRLPHAPQINAFGQPGTSNAFDVRNLREAVPMEPARSHHNRQHSDDRHHHQSLRRRGDEGVDRTAEGHSRRHDRARQATHIMHRVVRSEDYADIDDEDQRWSRRDGANSGKRRN